MYIVITNEFVKEFCGIEFMCFSLFAFAGIETVTIILCQSGFFEQTKNCVISKCLKFT